MEEVRLGKVCWAFCVDERYNSMKERNKTHVADVEIELGPGQRHGCGESLVLTSPAQDFASLDWPIVVRVDDEMSRERIAYHLRTLADLVECSFGSKE